MKKTRLYYIPAVLWTVVILLLTLLPGSDLPHTPFLFHIPQFDKVVHASLFFLFVLMWSFAEYKNHPLQFTKSILIFMILAIALGVAIEFIQLWWKTIHRDFEWLDMLADTTGAVLGAWAIRRYFFKKLK